MATFVPRLNSNGMRGNPYWYANNPFYTAGFGLPNCTCYAWGRWYEIMGQRPNGLSVSKAELWWGETVGYQRGQVPKLGAIICFADGPYTGLGHVAVVEKISAGGQVTFSNSAYTGAYFYTRTGNANNNYGYERGYRLQGFLYLPDDYDPPEPGPDPEPEPPSTEYPLPWIFWCRRRPF
jgi:surface antigen